ncbi:MAG TPA: pitrilysin family protein, partial [Bryobacteraceae bacterium]|nr:pitrilysin family protein [Bryobacteraceae bacterium]
MSALKSVLAAALVASFAAGAPRVVELPGKSPLVTLRIVFTTGAASDPADKPGLAHLTAEMLGDGGTKGLTYKQIVDAMYPMATSVHVYSDKEMTTFVGETHRDNLEKFYGLMRQMILEPGWRTDDFARIRDDSLNALRVSLRGNNDEELGKEELYNVIYRGGHPYGHEDLGTATALQKMTIADLQAFYREHYTQANLIIGLAGGYPPEFAARVKRDFAALPEGVADRFDHLPAPPAMARNQVTLVRKDTRSVAWSLGYPIDVKRGDPDFPALLLMTSWFGQHRQGGRLFVRMREVRGLNYGDYDYIEYFPRGMNRFEPEPDLARHQQIFQIWIRPVEPANAIFSLRLAMFELDRLVKNGIPEDDFQKTRSFLSKYINVLTKTKSSELGYAIDSLYYGIPNYNEYVKSALANLTAADVNAAIRRHLRADRIEIVGVAKDTDAIRAALLGNAATPPTYNAAKT